MANTPRRIEPNNIPAELKAAPQWVRWNYETDKKGKLTKVPYLAKDVKASSTDARTWSPFGEVLSDILRFDGIGIVCTNGLAGVDLDHHVIDGKPDEFAQAIIDRLNSYTEVSPSGEGIRIFVWGKLPGSGKNDRTRGIEMYDSGRYLTVTGWHVLGTPKTVENRDDELAALYLELFPPPLPTTAPPRAASPNNLQDQALLEMARSASNGSKFSRLWLGDWQSEYPSASEADLALCSILAFWTGCDSGRIDRLFRTSGLMREKWDERHSGEGETYAEMTISKAISGTNEVYQPDNGADPPPIEDDETRILTSYADLQKLLGPIEWDWKGWLARGLMTVIASESGTGKSALMMRLAKTFISGDPWPDGTAYNGPTGCVLWCEAEAAQAINLERAKSWKIPLDKLLFPLGDPMEDFRLNNPSHRGYLAGAALRPDVVAVIIDSLSGADSRAEKSTEDASSVFWLASLARDSGKSMLLSHHLRKRGILDGDTINLDRIRGASSIIQPARVVWALDVPDQQAKDNKRLQVIKSNIARFPEPVGMTISDIGVSFGRAPEPPKSESLVDKGVDLLLALLDAEPMAQADILKEFQGAGISERTMYRAKESLGVVSRKEGTVWKWGLPAREN